MATETCDFLVIGGGVVGITIALKLSDAFQGAKILLIEKEHSTGMHASGRNSGVLHAGFYYTADSLKARFTRDGNLAWRTYCKEHAIPINESGKLVVAQNEEQDKAIDTLIERGQLNNILLEEISADEARKIEPRIKTWQRALYSPTTATVDPAEIMRSLTREAEKSGVNLYLNTAYQSSTVDEVVTSKGKISARYVVNSAGLYSDKIAHDYGFGDQYYLLPFKGIYLYASEAAPAVRTNIYPVPDLRNPFLGVHFTISASGAVKLGPTAIPALWPEQYHWNSNFVMGEFMQTSGRHMRLVLGGDSRFRQLAIEEMKKYSRSYMVGQAQKLATGVKKEHFDHSGKPGIRAQLINKHTQNLEMDFIVEGDERSFHVLNAVSPAFTCALPFADHVVDLINQKLH